jgi:amidase
VRRRAIPRERTAADATTVADVTERLRTVDATTDDALGTSDTTDLLARLSRREVSAAELREAAMARAHAANPHLNAVAHWFDDPVRTEVVVPEDAPLAGIPTFIKDNEEVAGYPTTQGSRAVPDTPAPACSPIVTALLGLGLEPLGATTLPEFGLTASTESTRYGATRNPWDTGRSAGGSSGGSAAMVAAGVVPMAHANDGGGSIRIPASCCGLVGLKPSRGRLPMNPLKERIPVRIAAQGVLTRSVRDTALLLALADPNRPDAGLPPIGHVTRPGHQRLRIGMCVTTVRGLPLTHDTEAAVRAAGALAESLGHHVEEVRPPVGDDFATDFLRYWALLAFVLHRSGSLAYGEGFDGTQVEELTKGLSALLTRQMDRVPGSLVRLRRLSRNPDAGFGEYDLFLSPVTGYPAPPIGYLGPDVEFHTHLVRLLRFASMTPVQNVSGAPAMSLPLGRSDEGLPIGVHLAAPFGQERRLLEVALELEEAAPWPVRPAL